MTYIFRTPLSRAELADHTILYVVFLLTIYRLEDIIKTTSKCGKNLPHFVIVGNLFWILSNKF